MGNRKTDTTKQPVEQPSEFAMGGQPSVSQSPAYQDKITSIDQLNGVVLVETNRPDGATLGLKINDKQRTASVTGGQAWFYYSKAKTPLPLGERYTIEFVSVS